MLIQEKQPTKNSLLLLQNLFVKVILQVKAYFSFYEKI